MALNTLPYPPRPRRFRIQYLCKMKGSSILLLFCYFYFIIKIISRKITEIKYIRQEFAYGRKFNNQKLLRKQIILINSVINPFQQQLSKHINKSRPVDIIKFQMTSLKTNLFTNFNSLLELQAVLTNIVSTCEICHQPRLFLCIESVCTDKQPICYCEANSPQYIHFLHKINRISNLHIHEETLTIKEQTSLKKVIASMNTALKDVKNKKNANKAKNEYLNYMKLLDFSKIEKQNIQKWHPLSLQDYLVNCHYFKKLNIKELHVDNFRIYQIQNNFKHRLIYNISQIDNLQKQLKSQYLEFHSNQHKAIDLKSAKSLYLAYHRHAEMLRIFQRCQSLKQLIVRNKVQVFNTFPKTVTKLILVNGNLDIQSLVKTLRQVNLKLYYLKLHFQCDGEDLKFILKYAIDAKLRYLNLAENKSMKIQKGYKGLNKLFTRNLIRISCLHVSKFNQRPLYLKFDLLDMFATQQ